MSKKINIFIFFLSFYVLFSIGHYGGDGYEDYLTAESIILDGNISINDRPSDVDEIKYKEVRGITARDGKIYSSRGSLGVPFLLSVFYAMGHGLSLLLKDLPHDYVTMLTGSFYNPFISALNALFVFLIAGKLNFSAKNSVILTFIYGLTTMAPVYSRTGFSEPTLILFLLITAYSLISYSVNGGIKYIFYAAGALSYCVFSKVSGIIYLAPFAVYLAWVKHESAKKIIDRDFTIFLISLISGIGLVFAANYFFYGKWSAFGWYDPVKDTSRIINTSHFLKGLYYYLLSTGKGFFIYNLSLVPVFLVLKNVLKNKNKEAIIFIVIFIINLAVYSKSFQRGSLFSWGPRYLFPSVPFITLLLGYYLNTLKTLSAKVWVFVMALVGFLAILPAMIINQSRFYFFVTEKLKLEEYIINFVPDLSPIKGAWFLLFSKAVNIVNGGNLEFVYVPDYKLLEPVKSIMAGYDYFDLWFIKILHERPDMAGLIYIAVSILIITSLWALFNLVGINSVRGKINNG